MSPLWKRAALLGESVGFLLLQISTGALLSGPTLNDHGDELGWEGLGAPLYILTFFKNRNKLLRF